MTTDHDDVGTQNIIPTGYEMCTQMALVPIQHAGDQSHVGGYSSLPATVKSLQFKVGSHKQINKLGVGSSASTAGIDVGCDVVYFLAVLFDNDTASGSPGISSEHHSILSLPINTLNLRPMMVVPVFLKSDFSMTFFSSISLLR